MKYLIVLLFLCSCGIQEKKVIAVKSDEISSCTVINNEAESIISCPDGTETVVTNGADGIDGSNGTDGLDGVDGTDGIVELIDPCGNDLSGVDEVLIRTNTGKIIAWYLDLGLVVIEPGTYQTTDDQSCVFTVNSDNSITDTLTVQASRERPSGAFIDREVNGLTSFTVPSTMQIVNIPGPLSHSGQQWAHIETETTKYCYQMTGVTSKTLSYRFSILETDSCAASAGLPNDGLDGTEIATTSLTLRMNNSVKQSGNHVTTTVSGDIEITR